MLYSLGVACFGESDKGNYSLPYVCHSLPDLVEQVGNPTPDSLGIYYSVQALLYRRKLIFIRVAEEGYSYEDYLLGLKRLLNGPMSDHLAAICIPGVGSSPIIEVVSEACLANKSLLITTEADLYDYLTEKKAA